MSNIVLGVSGSVAAYRAADLARDLMRSGNTVRVCLTHSAAKFVTPALFEALSGQPCLVDVFDEPTPGKMAHIDWARWADLILVAPASANTLAQVSSGQASNMLSSIILATEAPKIFAPAMNPVMYANEANQKALEELQRQGSWVINPTTGDVACGENGQGKLASNAAILELACQILELRNQLKGKKVLITSGPTEEPIDDVRSITNRSSGKMGQALARAASLMGANVTVISGPVSVIYPASNQVVWVQTALQMLDAALSHAKEADWIIGCAAVADFRPKHKESGKIRRGDNDLIIELEPNPDIIAALSKVAKPSAKLIGFAAEPNADLQFAKEKIVRKGLFAIAHNDVSQSGIGFGSDQNNITLITSQGDILESGVRTKLGCAKWIFESLLSLGEKE